MKAKEVLQFKLAFRKVLGLTHRIPLSMRDRFELHNSRLDHWLRAPTSTGLESGGANQAEENASEEDDSADVEVVKRVDAELALEFAEVKRLETPVPNKPLHDEVSTVVCQPELLHTVTSAALATAKWGTLLKGGTVVAAIGFEDRSVGAWRQLLHEATPMRAILLRYPDPCQMNAANEAVITNLLKACGVETVFVDADGIPVDELPDVIYKRAQGLVAIDVTSMTKAIIYHLVRSGLMARDEVAILHTSAQEYFPLDSTMSQIAARLTVSMDEVASPQCLKETFDEMDKMVTGEKGPYQCVQISKSHADPSQPVFLAVLMSLKHEPIKAILEEGSVERSAFIYPRHSAGDRAHRSVVGKQLAEFLGQMYHGDAVSVKSLDHAGVYGELRRLHQQWSLKLSYNFELGLAGTKMHTVGAGMFASVAMPSAVYYSKATGFDVSTFTQGTGATHGYLLRRQELSSEM